MNGGVVVQRTAFEARDMGEAGPAVLLVLFGMRLLILQSLPEVAEHFANYPEGSEIHLTMARL